MARPRKAASDQRTRVLSVRLTHEEYDRVTALAKDAGMLPGVYARTTILDKRPRSKPANTLLFQKLIYELQSISTNFKQLHDATGLDVFLKAARFVGGQLVEQLIGRDDLSDLIAQQLPAINKAGLAVNDLAYKANASIAFSPTERQQVLAMVQASLAPLDKASKRKEED